MTKIIIRSIPMPPYRFELAMALFENHMPALDGDDHKLCRVIESHYSEESSEIYCSRHVAEIAYIERISQVHVSKIRCK